MKTIKVSGWVVFNRWNVKRAVSKKRPAMQPGEACVKLVLELPEGLFDGQVVTAVVPALDIIKASTTPAPLGMVSPEAPDAPLQTR